MTGMACEFQRWQASGRPVVAVVTLQDLQALIDAGTCHQLLVVSFLG